MLGDTISRFNTQTESFFTSEDKEVLEVVLSNRGAIFGGYLRDVYAQVAPVDIDVVISLLDKEKFEKEISSLYSTSVANHSNGTTAYSQEGRRPLEVLFIDDDPEDTVLGPCPDPDYDVNLLVFSRKDGLNDWTGSNASLDSILEHIEQRLCVALSPVPGREGKIRQKGYTVLQ